MAGSSLLFVGSSIFLYSGFEFLAGPEGDYPPGRYRNFLTRFWVATGSLALVAAARAHALIEHHSGVFPDDVQAVFGAVAGHRLRPSSNTGFRNPAELSRHVLDSVAIP